jgi:U3 small nucleolar RNA-associated protein 25
VQVLIYSERLHFYERLRVRGISNIIFYKPPTYPHFYTEMLNLLEEAQADSSQPISALVLYSKYDVFALERIVGDKRAKRMLASEKATHMFC